MLIALSLAKTSQKSEWEREWEGENDWDGVRDKPEITRIWIEVTQTSFTHAFGGRSVRE